MRLFTAIDISEDVKEALRALVKRLKPTARLSWSPVDNLHITTKFIGEWPESRLEEMTQALRSLPRRDAIDIRVRGLGWFPNERRPRVFWAGVDGGEPLRELAQSTEHAVAQLGVPVEDRAYSPHLTLARIRDAVPLNALHETLRSLPGDCGFDFGSFRATDFCLYLSANGQYTRLAAFPLE
jgi:2'-5' RNA ligase